MVAPPLMHCNQCGHTLPNEAKFCSSCGVQITHQPPPIKSTSPTPPPLLNSPTKRQDSYKQNRLVLGIVGAFAFLLILAMCGRTYTVDDYLNDERKKLETFLNTKPNEFGKHIENIHLTVTYKGGHVKSMTAMTVDGSKNAGKNGSNVSQVDVVITAYWEGYVQKNGYTEIRLIYDNIGNTLKSASYLDSNAVINTQTVDWWGVGLAVGKWLAL